MNSINSQEFKSKTKMQKIDGGNEIDGISMDFLFKFFDKFLSKSVGIDLSDVNFEVSKGE